MALPPAVLAMAASFSKKPTEAQEARLFKQTRPVRPTPPPPKAARLEVDETVDAIKRMKKRNKDLEALVEKLKAETKKLQEELEIRKDADGEKIPVKQTAPGPRRIPGHPSRPAEYRLGTPALNKLADSFASRAK